MIKESLTYGNKIKQKQIPKMLGVSSLFRVSLPCYWRFFYTIEKDKLTIIAFVIDIMNHTKYDRYMNY